MDKNTCFIDFSFFFKCFYMHQKAQKNFGTFWEHYITLPLDKILQDVDPLKQVLMGLCCVALLQYKEYQEIKLNHYIFKLCDICVFCKICIVCNICVFFIFKNLLHVSSFVHFEKKRDHFVQGSRR